MQTNNRLSACCTLRAAPAGKYEDDWFSRAGTTREWICTYLLFGFNCLLKGLPLQPLEAHVQVAVELDPLLPLLLGQELLKALVNCGALLTTPGSK
jgi:hypothetical protein